ncbi:hypothetical protein F4775DRAFT_552903 [Biscogniauxia sp. FL1348]|nr:hypothetical protein F4775DRAFT_552903 [Biscogniauxia sp. FL1348]
MRTVHRRKVVLFFQLGGGSLANLHQVLMLRKWELVLRLLNHARYVPFSLHRRGWFSSFSSSSSLSSLSSSSST